MKLEGVELEDFKRFTDLTVQGIPGTARLIILVGPNGCGKSSFFDGLHIWHDMRSGRATRRDLDYYPKTLKNQKWREQEKINIHFHPSASQNEQVIKKLFYFRSAYRNDPEFQFQQLTRTGDLLDERRTTRMIDNDAAVGINYQRLTSDAIQDAFERSDASITLDDFREGVIGEIKSSFSRLFPDMELNGLGNPLTGGTFRFTKGTSSGFLFKNLSGGEKAAFDLILDLVVARRVYDDTVFCIDEPESHMNARLQASLLFVLYDLIPDNCQLILATHSIGMMRQAEEIELSKPGSVIFLDFGNRDFDQPQVIKPATPNRAFWKRAYEVALDDLAALVAPSRVVICEGSPKRGTDAQCYERIFETEFPDTRFVSMGGNKEIIGDTRGLAETLRLLIDGLEIVRLIDRDNRTENAIAKLKQQGVQVLSWRNLEAYLFHDEVLQELAVSKGQEDKAGELIAAKWQSHNAKGSTNSPNDLKPIRREIYSACNHILQLVECGDDVAEFMVETLAPLIKPEMQVYKRLKRDIFDSPGFRVGKVGRKTM